MSDLKIFPKKISINGKRIIVRLDLNVPINNLKIDVKHLTFEIKNVKIHI